MPRAGEKQVLTLCLPRKVERLKATLTLRTRLFLRELREPNRDGERERTARNNAYAGVTSPTPSRTSYRSRRHFYVLLNAASRSLRRSGFSPKSLTAFRGPLFSTLGCFIFYERSYITAKITLLLCHSASFTPAFCMPLFFCIFLNPLFLCML